MIKLTGSSDLEIATAAFAVKNQLGKQSTVVMKPDGMNSRLSVVVKEERSVAEILSKIKRERDILESM